MSAQTITFQSDVSSVCINENHVLNAHPLHKLLKFMDYNLIIHRISLPLAVLQGVHSLRSSII